MADFLEQGLVALSEMGCEDVLPCVLPFPILFCNEGSSRLQFSFVARAIHDQRWALRAFLILRRLPHKCVDLLHCEAVPAVLQLYVNPTGLSSLIRRPADITEGRALLPAEPETRVAAFQLLGALLVAGESVARLVALLRAFGMLARISTRGSAPLALLVTQLSA